MMYLRTSFLLLTGAVVVALGFQSCNNKQGSAAEEKLPEQVSYNFDIRPILSDKCLACHVGNLFIRAEFGAISE